MAIDLAGRSKVYLTRRGGSGGGGNAFVPPVNTPAFLDTSPVRGWLWGYVATIPNEGLALSLSPGQALDSTNTTIITSALSTGITLSIVGNGGLDVGPATVNTFYHLYVIYGAGPGQGAIASLSPVAPALPPGFTLYRRVGVARTAPAPVFGAVVFTGLMVTGTENERWHSYEYNSPVLGLGVVPAVVTPYSLLTLLPPTVRRLRFTAQCTGGPSASIQFGGFGVTLAATECTIILGASYIIRSLEVGIAPFAPYATLYAQNVLADPASAVVYMSSWLEIL